jgi:metal-responsive CopG/Arc/MetJ family transcriptional regulator
MRDGNTTLTISIPTSLKKKIQAAAKREHRPVSNMIRVLLQRVLENAAAEKSAAAENFAPQI